MKHSRAHIALFIANLLYGINYPIAKSLMPVYLSPFEIIILRAGISAILFYAIHQLFFFERVEKKDMLTLALCGLFGISINQMLFFEGLNLTTPIDASIIQASNPVMVLIISSLLLKERITLLKTIGIALGAAGAILTILYGKKLSAGTDPVLGNTFIFLNALSYAIYLVMVKPLMEKYRAFTVMKWTFLFGFMFILPFSIHSFSDVSFAHFTIYAWLALAFVVIAVTFVAYLLIGYSMKFVNSSVASFYIYFQPVIASMLAIIMYDEKISIIKILSALMIFTGVYLVSRRNSFTKNA